ncbi:MAG: flagellar assembly protein FliW [Nitrospira sp.]|nr:flagellar assembly protein FliW [Nitrospira sp.]
MMQCRSTRFGNCDVRPDSVLTFPNGILGFPDCRRYVIFDHDTDAPFKWLQSLDEPGLAFVILDPATFHPEYDVQVPHEALLEVDGKEDDELILSVLLTIPSNDPTGITANLRGPLLMNPRTKFCKQLILSDNYPTRFPLFSHKPSVETLAPAPVTSIVCSA